MKDENTFTPRFAMTDFSVRKARQTRVTVAEVREEANISFDE
jgi:hypothetical protein